MEWITFRLQQYLPFTVLKRIIFSSSKAALTLQQYLPFTVLKPPFGTTKQRETIRLQQYLPFTVLKLVVSSNTEILLVLGCNSTYRLRYWNRNNFCSKTCIVYRVAIVLTVYGIETRNSYLLSWVNGVRLQQYLPFTVLKRSANGREINLDLSKLQQYLPFTVLKHSISIPNALKVFICCNSTYRLRYWNIRRRAFGIDWSAIMLQQYLPFTVLKLYSLSVQLFLLVWLQQYLPFTVLKQELLSNK